MANEHIKALLGHLPPKHFLRQMIPLEDYSPFLQYLDETFHICLECFDRLETPEEKKKSLADKLRNPEQFYSALAEAETLAFLGERGLHLDIEPLAPQAGPDFRVVCNGFETFVEVLSLEEDAAERESGLASAYVLERMRKALTKYMITFRFHAGFKAYQRPLKIAVKKAQQVLAELQQAGSPQATLYYFNERDSIVRIGELQFQLPDAPSASDLALWERVRQCGFVVTYKLDESLGPGNHSIISTGMGFRQVDDIGRVRRILGDKLRQLPNQARNLIVLNYSHYPLSEHEILDSIYGTTYFSFHVGQEGPLQEHRRANGFFASTTRVQAVAGVNRDTLGSIPKPRWTVFPTNNAQACDRMTLPQLQLFGDVPENLEDLAAQPEN